jgi:hypothetical protein
MKTGEGKTLVATLPVYLNALTGKGVHVITVNDYLATRDSEQMGQLYNFLGLSVGLIVHGLDFDQRKEAYAAAYIGQEGTAGVKDSNTTLAISENIVAQCLYDLVASLVKTKVDQIHRMIDSLKSILMSRMQEAKISATSLAE